MRKCTAGPSLLSRFFCRRSCRSHTALSMSGAPLTDAVRSSQRVRNRSPSPVKRAVSGLQEAMRSTRKCRKSSRSSHQAASHGHLDIVNDGDRPHGPERRSRGGVDISRGGSCVPRGSRGGRPSCREPVAAVPQAETVRVLRRIARPVSTGSTSAILAADAFRREVEAAIPRALQSARPTTIALRPRRHRTSAGAGRSHRRHHIADARLALDRDAHSPAGRRWSR